MFEYIFLTFSIVSFLTLYYLLPKKLIIKSINNFYPTIITNINLEDGFKSIALTIDDVPYGYEKDILNILDKYEIKVSLFVIANEDAHQKEDILIKAVKNGHRLCNHGITDSVHILKSEEALKKEIEDCQEFIDKIYDKAEIERPIQKYYRPGCGFFGKKMIEIVENMEYKLTLGSVYPHDPHVPISIVNYMYIIEKIEPGDIIIIHDRKWTVELLERLVPRLLEEGYRFRILE